MNESMLQTGFVDTSLYRSTKHLKKPKFGIHENTEKTKRNS